MPRRARIVLPVATTTSPLPQRVRSVCVACGGRNLIRFGARSHQLQCRSCGLVSPDFNQPKAPSGYAHEQVNPPDKNQAHAMLDEMLDALSHETTKRKLQTLQKQASGDVPLLCHFYVPFVVDVCAVVAAKYGFSQSIEGVMESLRVLQRYATTDDSDQFTPPLVQLRRILTPTGVWIKEDAEADADELKKTADEREKQQRRQDEACRMEEIAAENAKKARLRAKKIALGLDPSVPRLPLLDAEPPRAIVAHADASVQLRVVARYTLAFQWFFQGKLLPVVDDGDVAAHDGVVLYTGAQRSTLTVRRLTKRFVGDYYCVCTNEEGVVSSQSTRVEMVASLTSQRLATRKLKTIPSGGAVVPLEWLQPAHRLRTGVTPSSPPGLLALCVGGALVLLHAKTLAPAKTVPPIVLPTNAVVTAVAWQPSTKVLAVATSTPVAPSRTTARAATVCELTLYAIDIPTMAAAMSPSPTSSSSSPSSPSAAGATAKPTKHGTKPASTAPPMQAPPPVFLVRLLASHTIPAPLRSVHALRFLDAGRTLLVSDLQSALLVYELTPNALVCQRNVQYDDPQHPLCHIATTSSVSAPSFAPTRRGAFTGLAVCRRNCSSIELSETGRDQSRQVRFKFPVHRAAFDRDGFTLAVAESASLKTWISVVSIPLGDTTDTSRRPSVHHTKQFVAHVGKLSGLQWTSSSALLLTSGYDGYVKLWDLEHTEAGTTTSSSSSSGTPTCVFRVHVDMRGIHSLALLEESDPVACVAVGFSDCRLHVRELPQLRAFEATRSMARDRAAAQIQKIWKGRQTRDLIHKFIRPAV